MGLDAVVRCRCWEAGQLRTPPPYPEHVILDPEDDTLTLDLPWCEHPQEHRAFSDWLETCCPHQCMRLVNVRVSNWSSLRAFQAKLDELEIDAFETLRSILPRANGGLVPRDKSALALRELEDFFRRPMGTKVVLVDSETQQVIQEYIDAYGGRFLFHPGGWEGGVDPYGFFIRGPRGLRRWLGTLGRRGGALRQRVTQRLSTGGVVTEQARDPWTLLRKWMLAVAHDTPKREWFRSLRFRQETIRKGLYRLTDEDSARSFDSPVGVASMVALPDGRLEDDPGRVKEAYPHRLAVERRACGAEEFAYIVEPLRAVFQASVESGNPVQWC